MEQLAFSHHPSDFTHRPQPWKISTLNFLSTTSFVKSKNSSCHCLSPNTHLWTVPANSSQKAPRLPGDTWTFLWGANLNKTRLFSKKPNKSLPKTCGAGFRYKFPYFQLSTTQQPSRHTFICFSFIQVTGIKDSFFTSSIFFHKTHLLNRRIAMTMMMMRTTASTGPMTQSISGSSACLLTPL